MSTARRGDEEPGPDVFARRHARLEAVFRAMYTPLRTYATYFGTRDHADAEDVVQTSFLKLLSERGDLLDEAADFPGGRVPERIASYLYDSVRGRMSNTLRGTSRRAGAYAALEPPAASEPFLPPDCHLNHTELEADYRRALGRLTGRELEIFLSIRMDGLTFQEVADRLGVSRGTVQIHLARALKKLHAELARWVAD